MTAFISAAAIAGLFLSTQAHALSCAPHSVQHAFNSAHASADSYIIVVGTLIFAEDKLVKTDWDNQQQTPQLTRIPARISGKSLDHNGFSKPYNQTITLEIQCAGPWCPNASSGAEYLALINIDHKPASVTFGPCGGNLFGQPSAEQKRAVQHCLKKGACNIIGGGD